MSSRHLVCDARSGAILAKCRIDPAKDLLSVFCLSFVSSMNSESVDIPMDMMGWIATVLFITAHSIFSAMLRRLFTSFRYHLDEPVIRRWFRRIRWDESSLVLISLYFICGRHLFRCPLWFWVVSFSFVVKFDEL